MNFNGIKKIILNGCSASKSSLDGDIAQKLTFMLVLTYEKMV